MIETPRTILRPVTEQDLDAVLEVYRQCEDFLALGPVATASLPMVLADLELSKKEGGIFCGIFDRLTGQMLGVIDYVPCGYQGDPASAYLELLMIAAPYRSGGLGAEVVAAVEDDIRRNEQVKIIHVGTQANNTGGLRFWQRVGYRIISGPTRMVDGTTCFDLIKTA